MRILILGSTYLTEKCVNRLKRDGFELVGHIPSSNPTFPGNVDLPIVDETVPHDIKLSIQYDKKLDDISNAYNLHTGLLPDYGGCSILYHTIKNGEDEQGLTFHKMGENFDEGPIISKMTYPVREGDSVSDLYLRMVAIAPKFLSNALSLVKVEGNTIPPKLYKRNDIPEDVSQRDTQAIRERIGDAKCKIISVCFKDGGDVRTNVEYPAHNQTCGKSEDMLKMVKDLYEVEVNQDAGCPVDIYFVNSDAGYTEGNEWLASIDCAPTKNGHIYVITRENIGGSFGAYNFAFDLLKDKYNYFLFTEEDLFIFGKDYYKKAVERYEDARVGFLAFIGVAKRGPIHCHGGVGLVSRDVLNDVVAVHGELPHSKLLFDKQDVIRKGEIPFTNSMHLLGYSLATFGEEDWNEKNHILPYYNFKRSYVLY
jgi:hypothetical protein